jgi:hypothetical protein
MRLLPRSATSARAQLLLLADLEIGMHEQTRCRTTAGSPAIHAHIDLNGRYHIHPDRSPRRLVPGRDELATYK